MMVGACASEETSPHLALLIAGTPLAETDGVEDLAVGRLPKTALASVPWGFEKFDGVAGGVLKQDLLAASAADDLVAEVRLRVAQRLDLAGEIVNLKLDAVPAAWLRIAPVGHGLARSAGTGLVEQEAQVASRDDRETGGVKLYTEAEVLGVERDRCVDVINYVTYTDRGHLWSSSDLVVVCYAHGGTEKGWVHRAKARFWPVPSYGFLRLRPMGSRRALHSGLGQFGRFEARHCRESKTVR